MFVGAFDKQYLMRSQNNVMNRNIILKKKPKIEFLFLDNGFQINDEQSVEKSGFYSYSDLKFVELNKIWFPKLVKWLRVFTWVLNLVSFFPDAKTYKKANIIICYNKIRVGFWLTDIEMCERAKVIKQVLFKRRLNE